MSITVTMNLGAINEALQKNAKATRISASDVLRFEMGSLVSSMAKYTPPNARFSKRQGKDKDIGQEAIEADMNKLFYGLDSAKALKFVEKLKNQQLEIGRSPSDFDRFRNTYRRNGSVKFKPKNVTKIGTWQLTDQMYSTKSKIKAYTKSLFKHVGKLKAGWIPAINEFKGKLPLAWVTRHSGKGKAIVSLDRNLFKGWLGAVNSTPYASIINKKQVIPFVVGMHQRIIDTNIKNIVGNAVRRFNAVNPSPTQKFKVA